MIRYFILLTLLFHYNSYSQDIFAEKERFTRQDSLRGSITQERSWWDLVYYHLDIKIEPDKKFIEGDFINMFYDNRINKWLLVTKFQNTRKGYLLKPSSTVSSPVLRRSLDEGSLGYGTHSQSRSHHF